MYVIKFRNMEPKKYFLFVEYLNKELIKIDFRGKTNFTNERKVVEKKMDLSGFSEKTHKKGSKHFDKGKIGETLRKIRSKICIRVFELYLNLYLVFRF